MRLPFVDRFDTQRNPSLLLAPHALGFSVMDTNIPVRHFRHATNTPFATA